MDDTGLIQEETGLIQEDAGQTQDDSTPVQKALTLKAALVPLTTLAFSNMSLDDVRTSLQQKQSEAPALFNNLPCVLDLTGLDQRKSLSLFPCHQYHCRSVPSKCTLAMSAPGNSCILTAT